MKWTFILVSEAPFLVPFLPLRDFTHRFQLPQQYSDLCLLNSQKPLWSVRALSPCMVWVASSNRKPGQCEARVSLFHGSQTCTASYLIMEKQLFHMFCPVLCYGWQKNSNNFLKNNLIKYFFFKREIYLNILSSQKPTD